MTQADTQPLTHFDAQGQAHMVDVADKAARAALALFESITDEESPEYAAAEKALEIVEREFDAAAIALQATGYWSEVLGDDLPPTAPAKPTVAVQPAAIPAAFVAPPGPCRCCKGDAWWSSRWVARICRICHPPADGAATIRYPQEMAIPLE